MTDRDPLADLWAADDPPARDPAFVAAALERAAVRADRWTWVARVLQGVGTGAAVGGVALLLAQTASRSWDLALIAAALAGALVAGRALFSPR